jgi:hypothetical protein
MSFPSIVTLKSSMISSRLRSPERIVGCSVIFLSDIFTSEP